MEQLIQRAKDYNIEITPEEAEKFQIYSDFLLEYNEKVNLTAIREPEEVLIKHFLDSILAVTAYDIPDEAQVIDIGTGAGFPGVPLKIIRPDIELTLLDSLQKRIVFLEKLHEKLGISSQMLHARAEHLSTESEYRDSFDVATSRAVANLASLTEYALPYVEVGGVFMALKGPDVEQEVEEADRAIETLGGEVIGIHEYSLPGGDGRTIVLIEKVDATPEGYPRQGKNIVKAPL